MASEKESTPPYFDYLFIGGGFAGLATSLRVKNAHPEACVGILEASLCGAGASAHNSGIIHSPISYPEDPEALVFTEAQMLFQRTFPRVGQMTEGWIYGDQQSIDARRHQLEALGATWREVKDHEINQIAEISPILGGMEFLAVPQYIINPQLLVQQLVEMCIGIGVCILPGREVTTVRVEAGRATGIRLADGGIVNARTLILTSGVGTHTIFDGLKVGLTDQLRTRVQTMVAVSGLTRVVDRDGMRISLQAANRDGIGVVPAANEMALLGLDNRSPRLVLVGNQHMGDFEVDHEIVQATLDAAYQAFPMLQNQQVRIATWAGIKTDFIEGKPADKDLLLDDNPRPLVVDHSRSDGIEGMFTLLLGKMTLLFHASRDMAAALGLDSELGLPSVDPLGDSSSQFVISSPLAHAK